MLRPQSEAGRWHRMRGDQLAEKDFLVGIQRMDHSIQNLLRLGLELDMFSTFELTVHLRMEV